MDRIIVWYGWKGREGEGEGEGGFCDAAISNPSPRVAFAFASGWTTCDVISGSAVLADLGPIFLNLFFTYKNQIHNFLQIDSSSPVQ